MGFYPISDGEWVRLACRIVEQDLLPEHLNPIDPMKKIHPMKTFIIPLLACGSLLLFASCETTDYDDDDDDHDMHGRVTTTTTEETTLRSPYSGGPISNTIQTQTTQTR